MLATAPAPAASTNLVDAEQLEVGGAPYNDAGALRKLLECGALKLLKASYLLELSSLQRPFARRQDMPTAAVVDDAMLQRILSEVQNCAADAERSEMQFPGLVVVSYAWSAPGHPDADGATLHDVLAPALEWYMSERAGLLARGGVLSKGRAWEARTWACGVDLSAEAADFGVFLDFSAMHQHSPESLRTEAEQAAFRLGLANMDLLYGHQCTVKMRVTNSGASGGALPHGARGWPFFETCAAWLISDERHVLDLGAVDFKRPRATTCSSGTAPSSCRPARPPRAT